MTECSRCGTKYTSLSGSKLCPECFSADEEDSTCELCGEHYEDGGDGWDGLCPSCADAVSEYMDKHGVDRDAAVEAVKSQNRFCEETEHHGKASSTSGHPSQPGS